MTLTNLEIAERIHKELKKIPEVKIVEILPNCEKGIDLRLNIIVSVPWSWELAEKIASAISKTKWEIFEETGELPAIEWDVVER